MRTVPAAPLADGEYERVDAFWRAANYLAVGQLYLTANPLLRESLRAEHVKSRLLGHWGTVPGLTLVYSHLNRLIRLGDLDVLYVTGPGHGGPAVQAATWLEGSYSEMYPAVGRDEDGMAELFRNFSFPGGMPSHSGPEVPGSINEGGELGYSLAHAHGAVFDAPERIAVCVIGDGEAETGPLATAWHGNKFLDPVHDGAVLPVLHLNGYKIASPTLLDRIGDEELSALLSGYGYVPYLVEGDDPERVHHDLAGALDRAIDDIREIRRSAREHGTRTRPRWPMIVLRTPKGWTGPGELGGEPVEGTWRAHQIPLDSPAEDPERLGLLERWMREYAPEELFDERGRPRSVITEAIPEGHRRMGANPAANGGVAVALRLPDVREYAVDIPRRGGGVGSPMAALGEYLRDVFSANARRRDFRIFCPDELDSNKLGAVHAATSRAWQAETDSVEAELAPGGRVMEMLSEHTLQGWLEGYLLTGRHGLFVSYEAFVHIVDSMFNQFAKWLKVSGELSWRGPVPSLTYLLSSHVWQQDHNGFSHQDPGFLDHVTHKKPELVRVHLPPDANTLLCVIDTCLRGENGINVVVSGKQSQPNWLAMEEARRHVVRGIGTWEWAGTAEGEPDVVLACAGDVPTRETLAAVDLLRHRLPRLGVRVVNVIDLLRLQGGRENPHGIPDTEFESLFTADKPVVFVYHGYPWLIHRLTHGRPNRNLHVRGYREEGATTTPFDMAVRNGIDRYALVVDVIDHVAGLGAGAAETRQAMIDKRTEHDLHTREHGRDLPEVAEWTWQGPGSEERPGAGAASAEAGDEHESGG
ncbi:phosphoketolase family protein [Actinopolyspora halophila]|uniref:phosphoketolase family protein n=1 Tax=Actinopolyspora halophila TaxID=1850 RepID=UPI000369EBC0|nr:phosphoketolase family protein [Actinopolyspora halophila]